MTHGASLQIGQIWPKVLNDTVLGMLKKCVEFYSSSSFNSREPVGGTSAPGLASFGGGASKGGSAMSAEAMVAPTPTFFGSGVS